MARRAELRRACFVARQLASEPAALLVVVRDGLASPFGNAGLPELVLAGLAEPAAGTLLDVRAPGLDPAQEKYARLAQAFGIERKMRSNGELARLAIEYIRDLNRRLGVPPLTEQIDPADLDVLGQKAQQNTSTPSNPRPADAVAFTGMLARELARRA